MSCQCPQPTYCVISSITCTSSSQTVAAPFFTGSVGFLPWTVTPSHKINAENHHLITINVTALSQKTWRKISLFLGDTGLSQAGSLLPLPVLGTRSGEQVPGAVRESFPKAGVCGERVVIFLLCPQPGVIGRVPGAGVHPMTPEGGCRDDSPSPCHSSQGGQSSPSPL